MDSGSRRPARCADYRARCLRGGSSLAARRRPPLTQPSVAELREAMQARRRPFDPLSVLLGRCAQSLTAAGEVDPEIALSYVLWPTEALLRAAAEAD